MSKTLPFYLLEESESYQEKKFLDGLKIQLFGNQPNPDISTFDLKQHSFDDVMQSANTFSMFSSARLIFVQQNKDLKEDQEETLLKYIAQPNPTTTMVWKTKKLDKRKRFSKQVQGLNVLMSFSNPKPHEMSQWIDQIAAEVGIMVDRDAKSAFVEYIGTNLSQVHRELEKLQLYVHPENKIQKKHVEALVLKTNGDDVFAFTDQVIQKNLGKAYSTLAHLLEEGTVPLVLLSMLVRHYRILLKIHDGVSRRIPVAQLASFVMIPPFLVQRYVDQTKKIKMDECRKAIVTLQKLDKDFKSTGLSNRMLLEGTLLKLAQDKSLGI